MPTTQHMVMGAGVPAMGDWWAVHSCSLVHILHLFYLKLDGNPSVCRSHAGNQVAIYFAIFTTTLDNDILRFRLHDRLVKGWRPQFLFNLLDK